MTATTTPSRDDTASGSPIDATSVPADGATMTVCGQRTTSVECHRSSNHLGMHCGLLVLPGGKFADILWSDDWHAGPDSAWLGYAKLVKEMPMIPVCVFSGECEDGDMAQWVNS